MISNKFEIGIIHMNRRLFHYAISLLLDNILKIKKTFTKLFMKKISKIIVIYQTYLFVYFI